MTGAVVVPLSRAVALGRVAAPAAVASAGVHLALLDTTSLASLLMVAMAAVCLPCAWHLWRSPTPAVWRTTAALDATMLVGHAQMLAGDAAHAHGAGPGPQLLGWAGLGLVVVQLALAAAAVVRRR